MSKTWKKICIAAASVLAFVILLMIVFIPVTGEYDDTDCWNQFEEFDIASLDTVEVTGEDFKILQLTDLHYWMPHKASQTDDIVKTLVEQNQPDMIVLTGDTVFGPANTVYVPHVIDLMESFEILWAIVYGNHDSEYKADKFWQGEKYEAAEHCLYHNGPYNIGGTGNYVVNLTKDGEPFYSLVMMDSNMYMEYDGKTEYGCFELGQVSWYEYMITNLQAHGYDKSMMFFHIPLVEYSIAFDEWEEGGFDESIGFGEKREEECNSPCNTGMFGMIKKLGSTTHTFCGHDHINNYSVEYQGVTLTYGLKSSTQIYHDEDMVGGTLITIDSDKNVTVEHKYLDV